MYLQKKKHDADKKNKNEAKAASAADNFVDVFARQNQRIVAKTDLHTIRPRKLKP